MHRVFGQASRVISISITARDAEDALPQQLFQLVVNFANLSLIHQAVGQRLGQSQSPVGSFQQEGAAIGTALPLVKLRDDGLRKNIGEQKTLCCDIVTQAKASFGASNIVI